MLTEVGHDDVGRHYTVALYHAGCLEALPWGDEPFDCVVFLCDPDRVQAVRTTLSIEMARAKVDWVQVAGNGAKELHDAIDAASVAVGRQQAVGDGSPMTSWHEEALAVEEMADVASLCFGGHERVLVLVVGGAADLGTSVAAVKDCLTQRCI
jgi:hypothetical protein